MILLGVPILLVEPLSVHVVILIDIILSVVTFLVVVILGTELLVHLFEAFFTVKF